VLLIEEILTPFLVFQISSCAYWYYEEYGYYSTSILFLIILQLITSLYDTYTNVKKISEMAKYSCSVKVKVR
jgi:cation-transporting ATPase 13A3/4/5